MAQESFYGGRKGDSFIIVKQYESIAQMTEEFAKGSGTVGDVNYGEYVIIDTPNKQDSDNGKVYRRGFGGAEYIGQIVGPPGAVQEIELGDYTTDPGYEHKEYTPGNHGIVSGKDNNSIKYSYYNFKDGWGNVEKYFVGFQIPYYVEELEATSVDPQVAPAYTDITGADRSVKPFYRKYQVSIPRGYKGDSVGSINAYPTIVPVGTEYQTNAACTGASSTLATQGTVVVIDYKPNENIKFTFGNTTAWTKQSFVTSVWDLHYGYMLIEDAETPIGTQVDIGPINWIKEIKAVPIVALDETHLIVWYQTPSGQVVEEDLGNIKGEKGGISIICRVDSVSNLYNGNVPIKPEELDPASPQHTGWCVTVGPEGSTELEIYSFDYSTNRQYSLGSASGSLNPKCYIVIAEDGDDPGEEGSDLKDNGIWLATVERKSI